MDTKTLQVKGTIKMNKEMGLRENVKKGLVSIDEAIIIATDYNESIREWLLRRKKGNVKSKKEDDQPKKKKGKKKKGKNNASV
jgi:hypothetical protein